jgi:hypothetical protein
MPTLSLSPETRDAAQPPTDASGGSTLTKRSLNARKRNPRRNRGTPQTPIVVQTHLDLESSPPEWIEDELVRRGARHARLLENGTVSVTVCANSPEQAQNLVRQLLSRVSDRAIEIVEPTPAPH